MYQVGPLTAIWNHLSIILNTEVRGLMLMKIKFTQVLSRQKVSLEYYYDPMVQINRLGVKYDRQLIIVYSFYHLWCKVIYWLI